MRVEIRVENLRELRSALRAAGDVEGLRDFREGLKAAADIVAQDAKRAVPIVTGKARESIRATAGGNRAFVVGGKARVPYYGWLDFGSRSPRYGNPRRIGPWTGSGVGPEKGRFIYKAIADNDREIAGAVSDAMRQAMARLGF